MQDILISGRMSRLEDISSMFALETYKVL